MAGSDAIPPVPFEVEEAGRVEGSRAGLALPVTAMVIILQKWVPDGVSCEISTGFLKPTTEWSSNSLQPTVEQ
jgi:hypothetical protein